MIFHNNDNLTSASGAHKILLSKRGVAAKAAAFLCILAAMTAGLILFAADGNQVSAAEGEEAIGDTTASDEVALTGDFSILSDDGESAVIDWTAVNEVAAMIDALPNPYELSLMSNAEQLEVYYALMEADEAYQALTEEQQARIEDGSLDALYEYFNGSISLASVTVPDTSSAGTYGYYTYVSPNGGTLYYHGINGTSWASTTDTVNNYNASAYQSRILSLTSAYSSTYTSISLMRTYHVSSLSNAFSQNYYICSQPTWAYVSSSNPAHTFDGWAYSTSSSFSSWSSATTSSATVGGETINYYIPDSSTTATTLYARAKWKVTLTYDANGGSGAPSGGTIYYNLPTKLSSTIPTKSGCTFAGWSTSSSASSGTAAGSSYTYTGTNTSVTLYAVWKEKATTAPTYKVTYSYSGSSNTYTSNSVTSGTSITLRGSTYTRTGYTQSGWSIGGKEYSLNASYTVTGNVTATPVWTANKYTWTLNMNAENPTWTYYYFVYDSKYWTRSGSTKSMDTAQVPTWGNYTFAGWFTSSYGNGTQVFTSSGAKTGSYWSSSKWAHTGTGTLYAKWTYKLSYNANGGSGAPSTATTKTYGKSVNLSSTKPTRDGYTFLGWSTSSSATAATWSAGGAYNTDANTPNSSGKVVLYAVWQANDATVTFDLNGGTAAKALSSIKLSYNSSTYSTISNLSSSNVTRTGYTLLGWTYKTTNGTVLWTSSGSYSTTATSFWNSSGKWIATVSDFTSYAKWRANTYTIVYDSNGGTGEMTTTSATYDQSVTLETNEFEYAGSHFLGWSTSKTATSADYTDGQSVKNLTSTDRATVTLYAVWEADYYTITYDANGGSNAPASQQKTIGQDLVLRSKGTMTRSGYTFVGWSTSENSTVTAYAGGGTMTDDLSVTQGDTVTLYAVWVRDGANFNTTNVIDDSDMFAGDGNIRGGSGTTYSSSHIDSEYARVDGGKDSSTPGYFTAK